MTNHTAALLKLAADMEAVFNSSGPVDFDAFAARAKAIATNLEKAQHSTELIALAIEMADRESARLVDTFSVHNNDWMHVHFDARTNCGRRIKKAIEYLTMRNKLERHPTKPNLVRIKE